MADATWRPHPRFEFYEISDDGRVRSLDRVVTTRRGHRQFFHGREIKPCVNRNGYPTVQICIGNKAQRFPVHRLVCETFHGLTPAEDLEVRHLNGVRSDNRAENLRWGTRSENRQDCLRHGTHPELKKTHCPRGHEYSRANTYRPPSKPTNRQCRICHNIRSAASRLTQALE